MILFTNAARKGICNDRSDDRRLICWPCIQFSAEYRFHLGQKLPPSFILGKCDTKFKCHEILLISCHNGNIAGRGGSFRFE
jgi:hypothetical protein